MEASRWLLVAAGLGLVAGAVAASRPAQADPVDPNTTVTCPPRDEPLQCTETHLNEVTPNPDGKVCTSRADCSPTEFCGAGTCRTLDGELATLCVDKLWIEGTYCGDLDTIRIIIDVERRPGPYDLLYVELPLEESHACELVIANECAAVDLGELAEGIVDFDRAAYGGNVGYVTKEYLSGEQGILEWLDAGCRALGPGSETGSAKLMGQISLWYP